MKMAKKKKLENLKRKHNQYIKSLGVNIDIDTGEIFSSFEQENWERMITVMIRDFKKKFIR